MVREGCVVTSRAFGEPAQGLAWLNTVVRVQLGMKWELPQMLSLDFSDFLTNCIQDRLAAFPLSLLKGRC